MSITNKPKVQLGHKHPEVNIKRDYYAMASVDGDNAEIIMYGDIVEKQPMDWWTEKPVEGQYIVESDFLKDLNSVAACKTITIRMDSLGGDAGVSILIHNRLRELAAKGTKLICIVDGVAMSGGSLIMCACDTVRVNPSSLVMIHKCWTLIYGGYNADELRDQAAQNDAWDKAQAAIYKRKCKLSDTAINDMMADTTYMTGREAIEKGFADELLEDAEPLDIAASTDGRSLFVRGREMHLTPGMFVPDNIPKVDPEASTSVLTNTRQPAQTGSKKGGNKHMANTLDELRAEYPELTAQLEADARATVTSRAASATAPATSATSLSASGTDEITAAVQAEQKRIKEIDSMAGLFDAETVEAAKYGEHPCTAQEMTYNAAQKAVKLGTKFLADLEADTKASGAGSVPAASSAADDGADEGNMTPDQRMAKGRADAKALKKTDKEEK